MPPRSPTHLSKSEIDAPKRARTERTQRFGEVGGLGVGGYDSLTGWTRRIPGDDRSSSITSGGTGVSTASTMRAASPVGDLPRAMSEMLTRPLPRIVPAL